MKFHPIDEYRLVKYTRGIRNIVNFNGKIVPLQDEMIQFIKGKLEEGDVATLQKKELKKGEKIIIQEGPFKGFSGIFEQTA